MNINVSPPRKSVLAASCGSLKQRTINIVNDCLLETESYESNSKQLASNDHKLTQVPPKQLHEFGFSVRKTQQSNINWIPSTKTKKKKSNIRPQRNVRKNTTYPIREGTKVHFQTDENGEILERYAGSPIDHYLTREDVIKNWWTKKELAEIKEHANELCRFYLRERPGYKKAVVRLLARCGAQKTSAGCSSATPNDSVDCVNESTETDEEDDVSTLVDGDTRGLEKRMILSMFLPFHRYKRSINAALDSQKRLWAIDPTYFTYDQRVRLLATQYGLNAAYSTKWAHKIALGDARGVNRNFTFDW